MNESDPKPLTRDLAPFGLRIPPELKERIRVSAEMNNRSMNAEIISRLEAAYAAGLTTAEDAFELNAQVKRAHESALEIDRRVTALEQAFNTARRRDAEKS